jgi:hypothetical protein
MRQLFLTAIIIDGLPLAAGLEGYRRRLSMLMGPAKGSRNYPYSYTGFAPLMGWASVWTAQHREYQDQWLKRFAWTSRAATLGLPAFF